MAEPLRVAVAIVVDLAFFLLSAVVPGQLKQAFTVRGGVYAVGGGVVFGLGAITEKVEVEACVGGFVGSKVGHAEGFLVELQAGVLVLDADPIVQLAGRLVQVPVFNTYIV